MPTAEPWTAATKGLVACDAVPRNLKTGASTDAGGLAAKSSRSFPAQNESPLPRKRTTRTFSSASASRSVRARSAYIPAVIAFFFCGRSSAISSTPPSRLATISMSGLPVDDAVLHHERYAGHHRDVAHRVARHGDDVGELSGLDGAQAIGQAHHGGAVQGGGADRLQRRHAAFHHVLEFLRVVAVRGPALVGAERDLHASAIRARERAQDLRADRLGLGPHYIGEEARRLGLLADEPPRGDRGDVPGAVLLHEGHGFLVHVGAVLDRGHARADRALHAFDAMRVARDSEAVVARGGDDRGELLVDQQRRIAALR